MSNSAFPSHPEDRHPRLTGTGNPARDLVTSPNVQIIFLLAFQIALTVLIKEASLLATAHALGTFVLGLYFLIHDDEPYRLIYLMAYIVGMELIWRVTDASVFWEFGKYAVIVLLLFSMLKEGKLLRAHKAPLVYALLLLPSIILLPRFDREDIAFNLSGPIALAIATMYFSTVTLTRTQIKRVLLALLAPIASLAFLATFSLLSTDSIEFAIGSKSTAAGIGPNQVSSILGLGIFVAFFYFILELRYRFLRFLMLAIAVWLVAQTMFTFSRGGLWTGLGAVAVASVLLLRNRRIRGVLLVGLIVAFLIIYFVALPFLDDFTGGLLLNRLQDTDLSGRNKIMQADLIAFRENPVLGVGPGQSVQYHAITFRLSGAHTEYTRMVAEHGSLGLLALLILLSMGTRRVFSAGVSPESKAFIVACTVWAFLFMTHAAMRLAAPAFLFGLAASNIVLISGTHNPVKYDLFADG